MQLSISFIIPVYNRPEEIKELLDSFKNMETTHTYEIVIIEDGSTIPAKEIINIYKEDLQISYYKKENSGPGDSRNFGMKKAKGNYFIILDSDCLLPEYYLNVVVDNLNKEFVDCFGGPDAAHKDFTNLQKAIDFSMTSFITTGGIRGNKKSVQAFQPRSFNMGLSKKAFEATGGFGNIHPGEDPDLSIRLLKLGFKTKLIKEALVYHKRRISWSKFYKQVNKFGMTRPILNKWYPETSKITYWFPTVFVLGLIVSITCAVFGIYYFLYLYVLYFILALVLAMFKLNILVAFMVLPAILIQFVGYGWGFLKSTVILSSSKKKANQLFPELFFNN